MFRPLLRKRGAVHVKARLPRRAFTTYPAYGPPPIRALGPTLWCLGAVGVIYLGCATYEVRQDVKNLKNGALGSASGHPSSYEELEVNRAMGLVQKLHSTFQRRQASKPYPTLPDYWDSMDGADKMMVGAASAYAAVLAANSLVPGTRQFFEHVAASPRNYTLLTSTFGHVGLVHLLFNEYALYNFGPPVASSRTFQRSGSHLTAFYLSSGIMASLAWHLTSIWPSTMLRLVPALGASGAMFGLIGAFGLSYPDAKIGIVLLPGSLPASQALVAVTLFEAYGLFVGFKRLRFAHAAHLAGLAVGAAYVQFDGNRRLWQPTRRFAFNQMRRMNML